MSTPFTPVPAFQEAVYLKNPDPELLRALEKTPEDCTPDTFGRDWKWLEIPALPIGIKVHYGVDATYLIPAKPPRKKAAKKKVVAVAGLNDEESTRLFGFKKEELRKKFADNLVLHFKTLRSVPAVTLDELARTKGLKDQALIIGCKKGWKDVFANLSPLGVQELAEISLFVFHDIELAPVIPEKYRAADRQLATA